MKFAWLTDIHFNFCPLKIPELLGKIDEAEADAVLIGGDIGESRDVTRYLEEFAEGLTIPIYFVLGNHDYYRSSIGLVRYKIKNLCGRVENLHYLSDESVVELTPDTALIGHGGWGDARVGNYDDSTVDLNDYYLIEELSNVSRPEALKPILNKLGDEAADHVRNVLPLALEKYDQIWFLTHVPPWQKAAWHQGKNSDDNWAPHFACGAVGDALTEIMKEEPDKHLTVLCGHTHGAGKRKILPNILALTGGARYRAPKIQQVFEV